MRAVVQRASRGSVSVAGETVGDIGSGLVVLLGVAEGDEPRDAEWMAEKLVGLRIFEDEEGKMNRDLREAGGGVLLVSQFTLLGDCRKGRRPSFIAAAAPELAEQLYELVAAGIRAAGVTVATGRFRTHMDVSLVNDGPVTLLLDSRKTF